MSVPREPLPAQVVLSVLCSKCDPLWENLLDKLCQRLGEIEFVSDDMPFDHTSYYDQELGIPITRRLLGFGPLVGQDELASIKLFTNALEKRYARPDGKRTFNLDPGLLTQERLVLATGKNYTHRIYLGCAVFADLTLIFQGHDWQALPWTFPDYMGQEMRKHLTYLRDRYREKILAADTHREF